jgi:hypothetical protein
MKEEQSHELARVLDAASEQIGLALLDSHSAVERLGGSLERLAGLLSSDLASPQAASEIAGLRAEMVRAISALQFYDRMTQHLTHVREYLAGTVDQLDSRSGNFEALNRRLADRLLSDTHRVHLGRNFAVDFIKERKSGAAQERSIAPQGEVDLF